MAAPSCLPSFGNADISPCKSPSGDDQAIGQGAADSKPAFQVGKLITGAAPLCARGREDTNDHRYHRHSVRHHRRALRHHYQPTGAGELRRQRKDAGNIRRDPGRSARLSRSAIPHDRNGRGRRGNPRRHLPRAAFSRRLRARRCPLGRRRLPRHEHFGESQRPYRRGGAQFAAIGSHRRISRGRRHRHARRWPCAARDRLVFRLSDERQRRCQQQPRSDRWTARARLRRVADFDLRAARRRYLYQGRRRRRRPGRQGRGRNSRGRSAQPCGDRR